MSHPTQTRQRWALIGAVTVVVVVVGIVLAFGVVPYPSPPSVRAQPDPPVTGRLAYVAYDDGACLHVVDGTGTDRRLGCGSTYEGQLQWLGDELLGVRSMRSPDESVVDVIDPDTGEVISTVEGAPEDRAGLPRERADGTVARTGQDDGVVWVEVTDADGDRTRVFELEAPEDYGLRRAGWTRDGEWVVVLDSRGRALVAPADGDGTVRVWAEDVNEVVALSP